jgi:hypothetical protein
MMTLINYSVKHDYRSQGRFQLAAIDLDLDGKRASPRGN